MTRRLLIVFLALCTALLASHPAAAQDPDATATAQANALFEDWWQWSLRTYPEAATLYFGDHRYDDRLKDESPGAVMARRRDAEAFRERAARVDAARLSSQDRLSLRIFQFSLDAQLAVERASGDLPTAVYDDWAPVTPKDGLHLTLQQLAVNGRYESVADYEAWLKRLDAVPTRLAQLTQRMEIAMKAGWMPPRIAIADTPKQLAAQVVDDPRKSPEYAPFENFPKAVSITDRARLDAAGQRAIRDKVVPAFRRFRTWYETRYLPHATTTFGVTQLPGGLPYYQAWLDWYTTTHLSAREIHDVGLAEVARIGAQMDAIVAASGYQGTRLDYQRWLSSDPQFFYTKPDDVLAAFRDIGKRADAALPRLFVELPRLPYGIRAMRPEEGANAEYYTPGAPDGSRPGWFEANVNDLTTRPKWAMETLLLHEAVPGHHLEGARAQELKSLPAFRRHGWFTAYGEGWALYAESLGDEMGMYTDPTQKFGNLSYAMLRASRLVVDTGLHAYGWTRDRAVDYLVANTGLPRGDMESEVDRYLLDPGQATAYKVGEMKIRALRTQAESVLGDRFDVRRFHNAVIDNGPLPLAVLEQVMTDWIANEARQAASK